MSSCQAHIESTSAAVLTVTPAQWCQAYFVCAASACLALAAFPDETKKLLLDYGARTHGEGKDKPEEGERVQSGTRSYHALAVIIAWTQVPHSWFASFYSISLALSAFWLYQYATQGAVMGFIANWQAQAPTSASMGIEQVIFVWTMMALQAARRIYEQRTVFKPSTSKMWVGHWALGLSFYIVMSVAIWIEGSGAILGNRQLKRNGFDMVQVKISAAIPAILFAWVNQYRCHKQLAGLKKYSVPEGGLFRWFICPHYACECLFYLSLALAAAPAGSQCNSTLLAGLLFVAVNLGVTAAGTRRWYAATFGVEAVKGKWNMLPCIF